jgi:hypothetical protein
VRLVAVARTRKAPQVQRALRALSELMPALGATVARLPDVRRSGGPRFDGCAGEAFAVRYPGGEGLEFGLVAPDLAACRFPAASPSATATASAPAPAALPSTAPAHAHARAPEPAHPTAVQAPLLSGSEALVYLTGGGGDDEAALALAQRNPAPPPTDAALQVDLDFSALAADVHALPDSAYGTGPQVFVARSLVGQLLDPVQRLRARLELRPTATGALVDLSVSLSAPASPAPALAPQRP